MRGEKAFPNIAREFPAANDTLAIWRRLLHRSNICHRCTATICSRSSLTATTRSRPLVDSAESKWAVFTLSLAHADPLLRSGAASLPMRYTPLLGNHTMRPFRARCNSRVRLALNGPLAARRGSRLLGASIWKMPPRSASTPPINLLILIHSSPLIPTGPSPFRRERIASPPRRTASR